MSQPSPIGTVLLVEKDGFMRATIRMTLEEGGYHVIAVEDGAAAVDLLIVGPDLDVLVTGIRCPGETDDCSVARWFALIWLGRQVV